MIKLLKLNYLKHKKTIQNFAWRSLQISCKQGITFLIFILCAKLLNPYDFGIYNYILAIIFFLIMFGDFGISTATSKYVAEYNTTDKNKLKSILFNSLIILIALGFIVTLLTLLFGEHFLKEKYIFVLYALPLIFLAPISSLYDGIFRGLKRFKELAIISLSVGFFSIVFVYFLVKNFGLIGALVSQNLFYFILVLTLFFIYKNLYFQFDKKIMKEIFSYSIVIGLGGIFFFLYTRMDLLILGHFNYIKEIGYYEIVNKIYQILILPTLIIGTVVAPQITQHYSQKKYLIIRKKFLNYSFFSFISGISIGIVLYFLIPPIIKIFLKDYFTKETIYIFNLLLLTLPIKMIGALNSPSHIVGTGSAKYSLFSLIIFGLINVVLDFVFILKYGFIGVVYSTLICFSFANLLTHALYYLKLNKLIKIQKHKYIR
jgi:O-antigen/teichoic acid export membrane protein